MYQDELYHHGVKGMKWGIRKKRKDTDNSNTSDTDENQKQAESKAKLKRAVKIGAAATGITLAAYGGYKVSQVVKKKDIDTGKRWLEQQAYLQRNIKNIPSHVDPAHKLYRSEVWKHAFETTTKDRRMGIKADATLYGISSANRSARKEAIALMYDSLRKGNYDGYISGKKDMNNGLWYRK